jgi:hypothetical protein
LNALREEKEGHIRELRKELDHRKEQIAYFDHFMEFEKAEIEEEIRDY